MRPTSTWAFFLTFLLLANSVHAQITKSPVDSGQLRYSAKTLEHARLLASTYLSQPEYYQMVFVWSAQKKAENSGLRSGNKVQAAQQFVETQGFRNSVVRLIASGGTGFGASDDGGFRDLFDLNSEEGARLGQPDKLLKTGIDIFAAVLDGNSSDHLAAVGAVQRLKYDPGSNFDNQTPIREVLENDYFQGSATDIRNLINGAAFTADAKRRFRVAALTAAEAGEAKTVKVASILASSTHALVRARSWRPGGQPKVKADCAYARATYRLDLDACAGKLLRMLWEPS